MNFLCEQILNMNFLFEQILIKWGNLDMSHTHMCVCVISFSDSTALEQYNIGHVQSGETMVGPTLIENTENKYQK